MNLKLTKDEKNKILDDFEEYIKERTHHHLGYPYNLDFEYQDLSRFFKYSINNLGDPFIESNYGVHSRKFEIEVLNFFSELWHIKDFWGYVTNSGTEGNLQGLLIARENFPDGILYASSESHYSILKAAHFYKINAKTIPTTYDGSIIIPLLKEEIKKNLDKPVIINVNIGTTVKGAVDDIEKIIELLKELNIPRNKYYIHCDGALFAMMMPFLKQVIFSIDFRLPIDSIAISGHKFLGTPMPCGVILTRRKLMEKLFNPVEYLNSVDSTITGSRNGLSCLFLWNVIQEKGIEGFKKDVENTMNNAVYLEEQLKIRNISSFRNILSSTIVFERPPDYIVKKWQLACTGDIAHVVIMPSVNKEKINIFLKDIDSIPMGKICIKKYIGINCKCENCSSK